MLAGIHCPKMVEIREDSGRPAYSVPTGPDTSTYMGAIFLQEQRDTFIMLQSEANIPDSFGGPGRHKDQAKDPQASAQNVKWGNHPSQRHCGALICNVGETKGH